MLSPDSFGRSSAELRLLAGEEAGQQINSAVYTLSSPVSHPGIIVYFTLTDECLCSLCWLFP